MEVRLEEILQTARALMAPDRTKKRSGAFLYQPAPQSRYEENTVGQVRRDVPTEGRRSSFSTFFLRRRSRQLFFCKKIQRLSPPRYDGKE